MRCLLLSILTFFSLIPSSWAIETADRELSLRGSRLIFDGDLKENEVAITFGGAIVPGVTEQLLDILKVYGIRAHFFVSGLSAKANLKIVERIVNEGHILASGGYGKTLVTDDDTDFESVSQKIETEITVGHEMVFAVAGIVYPFVRVSPRRDTTQARTILSRADVFGFYWSFDYEKADPAGSILKSLEYEGYRGVASLSMGLQESTFALISLLNEMENRGMTAITFLPPAGMTWREHPPLVREQIIEAEKQNGSLIERSHAGWDI